MEKPHRKESFGSVSCWRGALLLGSNQTFMVPRGDDVLFFQSFGFFSVVFSVVVSWLITRFIQLVLCGFCFTSFPSVFFFQPHSGSMALVPQTHGTWSAEVAL